MDKSQIIRKIAKIVGLMLLAGTAFYSTTATAEEELIGSDEFRTSCAVCHGVGGRGDGHMAQYLNIKPTDLTMLTKNNAGKYPFMQIYQMVDGRADVAGHGDRAMPIWGDRYNKEDVERYGGFGAEDVVQARILQLVYYIQAIQQ